MHSCSSYNMSRIWWLGICKSVCQTFFFFCFSDKYLAKLYRLCTLNLSGTYCSCHESSVASSSCFPEDRGKGKGKVVLADTICMRSRGIASRILNLGSRRKCVVGRFSPRERTPVPTEWEAGWAIEPVWTFQRRGISAENWKSVSEFGITVRSVLVRFRKNEPKVVWFPTRISRRVRNITKLTFVTSVHPHGTTRLPVEEFSWNFMFEYFSKTCRENSGFIKIWQE
jgi:hypothetical protein